MSEKAPIVKRGPKGAAGFHKDRLEGLRDLIHHAQGKSVLDIGMNRGLVAFEFARHGAAIVHGCDIYEPGVAAAREIFSEMAVPSKFEVVNLADGSAALKAAFGGDYLPSYDIVLFLGIYHKLKRQTSDATVAELVGHLVQRTGQFFAVRTKMLDELGGTLSDAGLRKVHFSSLSIAGPIEIWQKDPA